MARAIAVVHVTPTLTPMPTAAPAGVASSAAELASMPLKKRLKMMAMMSALKAEPAAPATAIAAAVPSTNGTAMTTDMSTNSACPTAAFPTAVAAATDCSTHTDIDVNAGSHPALTPIAAVPATPAAALQPVANIAVKTETVVAEVAAETNPSAEPLLCLKCTRPLDLRSCIERKWLDGVYKSPHVAAAAAEEDKHAAVEKAAAASWVLRGADAAAVPPTGASAAGGAAAAVGGGAGGGAAAFGTVTPVPAFGTRTGTSRDAPPETALEPAPESLESLASLATLVMAAGVVTGDAGPGQGPSPGSACPWCALLPDGEARVLSQRRNAQGDVRMWCPRAADLSSCKEDAEAREGTGAVSTSDGDGDGDEEGHGDGGRGRDPNGDVDRGPGRDGGDGGRDRDGGGGDRPFTSAKYADTLRHFQWHWSRGHPVLVREIPTEMSWEPNVIERAMRELGAKQGSGGRSDRMVPVINCTADGTSWGAAPAEAMTPHDFFKGFTDASVFTHAATGDPLLYKLKGWPSQAEFRERLPRHHAHFIRGLPFPEYTNPCDGPLNLVTHLPRSVGQPDLGPRASIAFGRPEERGPGDSVTRLHASVMDGVHALMYSCDAAAGACAEAVGDDDDGDGGEGGRGGEDRGGGAGDGHHTHGRPVSVGADAPHATDGHVGGDGGASWQIFRREDIPAVSAFVLSHRSALAHCPPASTAVHHPIYDATFFLTAAELALLLEETHGEVSTHVIA
jgi:hypothetical protein